MDTVIKQNIDILFEEIYTVAMNARRQLFVLGFITEAENRNILERLLKYQERNAVEGDYIKNMND